MPTFQCPIEDCEYATPDVEPALAATMLTIHATPQWASTGGQNREGKREPKLRHRAQTRTGSILERDGMTMSGPPECEDLTSSYSCWNVVTGSCGGTSPGMQGGPYRQN